MNRRTFVRLLAAAASARAATPLRRRRAAPRSSAPGCPRAGSSVPTPPRRARACPVLSRGASSPCSLTARSTSATGQADDGVVREMMAQGMRALTGASTTAEAWRRFFVPEDVVGIKVNCGGYPYCVSASRDRGRDRAPVDGRRRTGDSYLRLRAFPEPAGRGQLRAARCPRVCRSSPPNAPTATPTTPATTRTTYLETNLFGEEDTRSNMMRLVSQRLTKIINIPNMKDHGATGVDRLPQEHRVRQLLERRPHASARRLAHLFDGRHARRDRAAALAHGAADHGRAARRLARRAVRADDELRLLSAADHVRHRSGRDRSPAPRHRRTASAAKRGRISIWDRSPTSLKMDDTRVA